MKKRRRVTRARLRELLDYDSETGEFRWRKDFNNRVRAGDVAGTTQANGHRFICIDGRGYRQHHLVWFYMKGRWSRSNIDHRDGDIANNRWANLRRATRSQNNANRRRPRNNTSGFKGVHRDRSSGKWRACIGKDGVVIHLGRFEMPEAAHEAYVAAARKLFGEFARTE